MPSLEFTAEGRIIFGEISVEDLKQIFRGWDSRFGFVCRIDMKTVGIRGEILPTVPEWLLELCQSSPFIRANREESCLSPEMWL